jgi:hypothetical protein
MMIDVIRNADTEDAIYFMLTAYLEATRFRNTISYLPEEAVRLPLGGHVDVSRRFSALITALDNASKSLDDNACAVLTEALRIFGAAVYRLTVLDADHVLRGTADASIRSSQMENTHAA